jgi:hypothetical protein
MNDVEQKITDLLKNSIMSAGIIDREKIKQSIEKTLKGLMDGPDQVINNFKVDVVVDSPEIQIIREVMEELNDEVNVMVTIQPPPINYIEYTFNIEPDTDSNKLDEIIEEINDEHR